MSVSSVVGNRRSAKADAMIVFVAQDAKNFKASEKSLVSEIPHLSPLFESKDFTGKALQTGLVYGGSATTSRRVILVGLGEMETVTPERIRRAAAAGTKRAAANGCSHVAFEISSLNGLDCSAVAQAVSEGSILSQYRFDKYKTESKNSGTGIVTKVTLVVDKKDQKAVAEGARVGQSIIDGVILARDLANAPNNEIYPETLAKRAVEAGRKAGFKVTVFNKKKITELKMGGLLAVNAGSVRPPVFIVMEYLKGPKGEKPLVLVGKGITFDTGGI
ncbi:MAG: hypothetical protein NTX15_01300, partial [Candidatus Kapabacteria bacterium]|nr:hypothetical protein [Candidatus Kapabacteria bacterium]